MLKTFAQTSPRVRPFGSGAWGLGSSVEGSDFRRQKGLRLSGCRIVSVCGAKLRGYSLDSQIRGSFPRATSEDSRKAEEERSKAGAG